MSGTEGLIETPPTELETPPPETPAPEIPEDETPEPAAVAEPAKPKPADPVQVRIDQLTREKHDERRAREAAEAERDALKRKIDAGTRPDPPNPAAYTDAEGRILPAEWQAAQREHEDKLHAWREAQKTPPAVAPPSAPDEARVQEALATFLDRAAPLREQHADFEEVVNRPVFTPEMREVLFESEIGPQLAYHLGQHQADALRIGHLPPAQMYRELGKLEARLSGAAPPAARVVSNAPPPIAPVHSTATSTKDPDKMTTEEYMAWDKARTLERLKGNPLGL